MPKRWKCLLAGPPEAGKSTLCAALLEPGSERRVIKTQSPVFHKDLMVDLPGEYITYPQRRTAFLVAAEDVRAILYVQSATAEPAHVPPGLLQTVPNLLIAGIISKIDHPGADIPRAERGLARMACGGRSSRCRHSGPKRWSRCAAGLERTISSRAPEPGKAPELEKAL